MLKLHIPSIRWNQEFLVKFTSFILSSTTILFGSPSLAAAQSVDVTTGHLGDSGKSIGVAWGDYDNDGDLNRHLANYGTANRLMRNGAAVGNHWLQLRLVGTFSNVNGIGTQVRLVAGGQSQIREVHGGSGYLSENSVTVEFGLGTSTNADTLEIRWPNGPLQVLTEISVDQRITVAENGPVLAITTVTPSQNVLDADPTSSITVQFSQPVSEADLNSMPPVIHGGDGREVPYTASDDGAGLVTLTPSNPFRPGEKVTVLILAGITAVQSGLALGQSYQWSFWTSTVATSMNFVPKRVFAGVQAFAVGSGDWDENGTVDLAVAEYNYQGYKLKILLNDGNAGFAVTDSMATPDNPVSMVTADVDRDQHLDIILGHASGRQISVWRGQGDGTFTGPESYVHGYQVNTMEAGDLDNDGYPDLVTANRADGTLTVFWNDGTGVFTIGEDAPNTLNTRDISLGDWDLDGDLDIATASGADGHLIHKNLGGRNFAWGDEAAGEDYDSWSVLLFPWAGYPYRARLDLIGLSSGTAAVLRSYSNAIPLMWSGDEEQAGDYPDYPVLANIDGDNSPDFLFVNYLQGSMQVRLGYYYQEIDIVVPVQNYPEKVPAPRQGLADIREPALGDFDGNGSLDWVEAFRQGGDVWVMMNDDPVAAEPVSLNELSVPIPPEINSSFRSKIEIAANGAVNAVGRVGASIFYGLYEGHGWLTEDIGEGGGPVLVGHYDTFDLALGPDGTPHVVYVDRTGNIHYAVRGPGGWNIEDVGSGYGPCLAVSSSGEVVVAAMSGSDFVAYQGEGEWEPVTLGAMIKDIVELTTDMVFDPSGNVRLVLSEGNSYGDGVQLRYWERTNGVWTGETVDEGSIGEGLFGIALTPGGNPLIGYAALDSPYEGTMYAKLARKVPGGWETEYVLRAVDNVGGFALGPTGESVMLTGNRLLRSNGSRWTVAELPGVSGIDDLAIDANGNLWASYNSRGIFSIYTTADLPDTGLTLNDATAESGLPGDAHATSGVTWDDFDQDGWPDLFVSRTDGPSELYKNNGDGTFAPVADPLFAAYTNTTMGLSGDYGGDGFPDLYLLNPEGSNTLLRAQPGLTFEDRTAQNLALPDSSWAGTWVDYDSDGLLDLHVCNLTGPDCLMKNMGAGVFELQVGVLNHSGASQYAAWADWDADGDQDLYLVTGSGEPNQLWRNDGTEEFAYVPSPAVENTNAGEGACWGDYDNDGLPDLFLTIRSATSRLYHNLGNGDFEDATNPPMGEVSNGRAASWGDYDNDGDLDLYVAYYNAPNRLFRNDGESNGQWDFTSLYGNDLAICDPGPTVGVANADYDKDGDLDLYLTNEGGSDRLLRNDQTSGNHWLEIALENSLGGSSKAVHSGIIIGTKVRVVAGGIAQVREVCGSTGYASQSWQVLHFGLGSTSVVDSVVVEWPQSGIEVIEPVPLVDQVFPISEKATAAAVPPRRSTLYAACPNPFNPRTTIRFELAKAGRANLRIFDVSGRLVAILTDGQLTQGTHTTVWDGRDLHGQRVGSGVYFYQLKAEDFVESKRMVLLK